MDIILDKLEINNTCASCDSCRIICPEKAIITNGKDYAIDTFSCTLCSLCIFICPTDSVKVKK